MYCIARLAGTHMVQSYNGQTSVAMLDYGHVFVPKPLSDEERQALADKTRHNREAAAVKALKANQDAADKGDAYGLMRMGERYRDGDGVDKDTDKARDYLKRAADAGSPTAQTELASLPQAASGLATEK
jgi:TPR repeat protein